MQSNELNYIISEIKRIINTTNIDFNPPTDKLVKEYKKRVSSEIKRILNDNQTR